MLMDQGLQFRESTLIKCAEGSLIYGACRVFKNSKAVKSIHSALSGLNLKTPPLLRSYPAGEIKW